MKTVLLLVAVDINLGLQVIRSCAPSAAWRELPPEIRGIDVSSTRTGKQAQKQQCDKKKQSRLRGWKIMGVKTGHDEIKHHALQSSIIA